MCHVSHSTNITHFLNISHTHTNTHTYKDIHQCEHVVITLSFSLISRPVLTSSLIPARSPPKARSGITTSLSPQRENKTPMLLKVPRKLLLEDCRLLLKQDYYFCGDGDRNFMAFALTVYIQYPNPEIFLSDFLVCDRNTPGGTACWIFILLSKKIL